MFVSGMLVQVILKDSVTLKSGILLSVSELFLAAQNHGRGVITSSSAGGSSLGSLLLLGNEQHQRLDKDSRGGVFVVGVGNRKHDGRAYRIAGVPASCVLIIDTQAVIKIWSDSDITTVTTLSSSSPSSSSPISSSIDNNKTKNSDTHTINHQGDIGLAMNTPPPGGTFHTYNDARLLPYLRDSFQRHCDDQQSR